MKVAGAIANIGYPVGMGLPPDPETARRIFKAAARVLLTMEPTAKMIAAWHKVGLDVDKVGLNGVAKAEYQAMTAALLAEMEGE